MDSFYIGLIFGCAAAAANVAGGLLVTIKQRWDEALLKYFIALGAGFMLGAAFLGMIPESIRLTDHAPLLILAGYLLIHFAEHILASHFHFGEETHTEVVLAPSVSLFALAGLLIHTFFDGVSIASGFHVSVGLGFLIFVAVALHKIPEGFTVGSIMLAAGRSRMVAMSSSIGIGLSTIVGAICASYLQGLLGYRLALSAGVMIYVAASDLMPEVNREKGILMALMVFVGILLFYLTERLLSSFGF
ncbi:MAG: ZIP family metal transporter [candidate division NC10 bacterium]|nr:ZIP family metal transporter [candidate division NC10 bacterium]MDE2322703.1 ZIP family metal transporter [candidate division NC10 bacterium]